MAPFSSHEWLAYCGVAAPPAGTFKVLGKTLHCYKDQGNNKRAEDIPTTTFADADTQRHIFITILNTLTI